jgi:hypothetical protein
MAEKKIKTRIQQKHDIEANWELATNFIPMAGELIIYDIDANYSYERFKIGDGVTNVNSLPFTINAHNKICYGVCSTAAGTAAKTVTVDDFTLTTGAMVLVKFTYNNTASSPTLNVNSTGAKPIYRYGTTAVGNSDTTSGWRAGALQLLVYDGTGWVRSFWENTTYANTSLGHGYGTCATAAATAAKVVTLSSYSLSTGGVVAVKFTYDVPASATMNINSKGAKNIFHRGVAITANVIKGGDIATFMYDGTQYHLLSVDRWHNDIATLRTDLTNHTHSYAGSSSVGGAATSANKVNAALTIKLNGGSTEGTNKFTFDGSAAKTLDVAPASHSHSSYVNQNAFSTIAVSGQTSVAADSATDTVTFAGSNVSITTDATNDKVTFSVANGTTSAKGVVQLTDSTSSTSTTTAATPNSVKAAYDKANHSHPYLPDTTTYAGSSSKGGSANSAVKLATARTIALDTGVTGTANSFDGSANITIPVTSIKESYLSWGGKNFAGGWGPIDAAMVPQFAANRFAFLPASAITSEYSTDGGSTWTATTASNARENIFATSGSFYIGNNNATGIDKANYKCRITITTSGVVYSTLNKFAIRISTNGSTGCHVKIESRTKANQDSGTDTWVTNVARAELSGWSGWNIINVSGITTHGNTSAQYSQLRFTFGVDSHPSTSQYNGLNILSIMAFGGEGWTTPSTMASNGHLYSYDAGKNATFPAQVTANNGFIGNLTGNVAGNVTGNVTGSSGSCTGNAATATNVAWTGITSKPDYYDAKAITSITREGTTFTATYLDGTTSTFTQQDNNFSVGQTSLDNTSTASTEFPILTSMTSPATTTYFAGGTYRHLNIRYQPSNKALIIGSASVGDTTYTTAGSGKLVVDGTIIAGGGSDQYGIVPARNNYSTLGTSTLKWWQVYATTVSATTFSENGTNLANKYAAKSHTHSNLVVKLNGGATEGTDLFTYTGGTAKTINITPASIGAAASSHGTHVTYGSSAPAANGTASAGSATTVSRSDHVHPLQTSVSGSSGSCTGNAATATKATQDGSGNVITSTYVTKTTFNAADGKVKIGSTYYSVATASSGSGSASTITFII